MPLFSLLLAAFLVNLVAAAPEVVLGETTLVGRSIPNQEFFGGIPFASPPLGQLRFHPPVLQKTLNVSTFDASNFGLACLQPDQPVSILSEDCLTINVFRPAGIAANASLPVMVWIYGGGFVSGFASSYNGSTIVAESISRGTPVIYVNFNYRVGPFGFPQGNEAAARGALNLGLKDQLAAFEWVQGNIGIFGGDKNKVTVFGESAGAISLAIHFLNPEFGEFARAGIFESGSGATTPTFDATRGESDWEHFVAGVPACASLATSGDSFSCLRAANTTEMLQAYDFSLSLAKSEFPWPPTLDGPGGIFPDLPSILYKKGAFVRLPFIAGTNLDEGTYFTPTTMNSSDEIRQWIIANCTPSSLGPTVLASAADKILDLYPDDPALGSPFGTGNETFGLSPQFKRAAAIVDDISFQAQRRLWIRAASGAGVKTFGYLFTDPQPEDAPYLGVMHGSELAYVYGGGATPEAAALSLNMINYWVSFATSLDPNDGLGTSRPNWPRYTPQNQVLLQLNGLNTTLIPDNYREEQIAYINSESVVFRQ